MQQNIGCSIWKMLILWLHIQEILYVFLFIKNVFLHCVTIVIWWPRTVFFFNSLFLFNIKAIDQAFGMFTLGRKMHFSCIEVKGWFLSACLVCRRNTAQYPFIFWNSGLTSRLKNTFFSQLPLHGRPYYLFVFPDILVPFLSPQK